MKRRRHSPEQIVRKLREADRLLAEGREIPEVAKQLAAGAAVEKSTRPLLGGLDAEFLGIEAPRSLEALRWDPRRHMTLPKNLSPSSEGV
jgi:hypothetical protein